VLEGCNTYDNFSKDAVPLYLKRIQTPDITIGWYYKSLISNITPDFVVLTSNQRDTIICKSHNISDVVLFGKDSIQIIFCGKPELYTEPIDIPSIVMGYKIVTKVLLDCNRKPTFRKTFY
jgi:hypothetical protein